MAEVMYGLVSLETGQMVPVRVDEQGRLLTVAVESAADGTPIPLGSLDESYSYNADGSLAYSDVVYNDVTYRTIYTYSAGRLASIAKLVPQ